MKKIITFALSMAMIFGTFMSLSAEQVTDWQSDGENYTITHSSNGLTSTVTAVGGLDGLSYRFDGQELSEEEKTVELYVELSKDYQHGELFAISLGFGTMNEAENKTDYASEFIVQTIKDGDKFVISSGVAPEQKIEITEPGIYKYVWTVSKNEGVVNAKFHVEGVDGSLEFTTNKKELNNSTVLRYVWAFGRDHGSSDYRLDRDLVFYNEKPVLKEVKAVLGSDGVTEGTSPKVGDVLQANVVTEAGTNIYSYPSDSHVKYTWYYVENDQVIGTASSFSVTADNEGKTIAVKVEGIDGYTGTATWEASEVVKVEGEPVEPEEPSGPTCAGSKDKNCDGVVTCDEEKGEGWTWNNKLKVCEYTGKTSYTVVNTAAK